MEHQWGGLLRAGSVVGIQFYRINPVLAKPNFRQPSLAAYSFAMNWRTRSRNRL